MRKEKLTIRLAEELVLFLDAEVARSRGSNRSIEIAKAVQQRQISMLPKAQRESLYRKLAGDAVALARKLSASEFEFRDGGKDEGPATEAEDDSTPFDVPDNDTAPAGEGGETEGGNDAG